MGSEDGGRGGIGTVLALPRTCLGGYMPDRSSPLVRAMSSSSTFPTANRSIHAHPNPHLLCISEKNSLDPRRCLRTQTPRSMWSPAALQPPTLPIRTAAVPPTVPPSIDSRPPCSPPRAVPSSVRPTSPASESSPIRLPWVSAPSLSPPLS